MQLQQQEYVYAEPGQKGLTDCMQVLCICPLFVGLKQQTTFLFYAVMLQTNKQQQQTYKQLQQMPKT